MNYTFDIITLRSQSRKGNEVEFAVVGRCCGNNNESKHHWNRVNFAWRPTCPIRRHFLMNFLRSSETLRLFLTFMKTNWILIFAGLSSWILGKKLKMRKFAFVIHIVRKFKFIEIIQQVWSKSYDHHVTLCSRKVKIIIIRIVKFRDRFFFDAMQRKIVVDESWFEGVKFAHRRSPPSRSIQLHLNFPKRSLTVIKRLKSWKLKGKACANWISHFASKEPKTNELYRAPSHVWKWISLLASGSSAYLTNTSRDRVRSPSTLTLMINCTFEFSERFSLISQSTSLLTTRSDTS